MESGASGMGAWSMVQVQQRLGAWKVERVHRGKQRKFDDGEGVDMDIEEVESPLKDTRNDSVRSGLSFCL